MFEWILSVMQTAGYAGLFFLMLLENIFPPIPSEVVIPLAGFLAATGEMNAAIGMIVAAVGATLGATLWYYIGNWIGLERLRRFAEHRGKWIGLSLNDIDKAERHNSLTSDLGLWTANNGSPRKVLSDMAKVTARIARRSCLGLRNRAAPSSIPAPRRAR